MEPISILYSTINRSAVSIKPKRNFFDWINYTYPDSHIDKMDENCIYLVRERDSNEEIEKWLEKNYDDIFQNEMNGWITDESAWIQNRTFKLFKEYFDYEIHSMIWDLEDTRIIKE